MNREIKFRGKTKKGNWVYGNLVETINEGYAFYILKMPSFIPAKTLPAERFIEVTADTVGEYTNLKDRYGVEIYEHDILQKKDFRWVVKWHDHGYWYGSNKTDGKDFSTHATITHHPRPFKDMEVVGNIHDNPE